MNRPPGHLVMALAGNPNSGKTTIFNNLTGANQHVANYPGVTVERKEGWIEFGGRRVKLVDLPGTYSLSAHSPEEIIARDFIIKDRPDVVIDIVDASNVERNLYLTTQLMELGVPLVIALNMSDMARQRGVIIEVERLSNLLGLPIIPTVGNRREGMDQLLQAAVAVVQERAQRPARVNYGREFETELDRLTPLLQQPSLLPDGYEPRWVALRLLEEDADVIRLVAGRPKAVVEDSDSGREEILAAAETGRRKIESFFGDSASTIVADHRYGFISGACSEAVKLTEHHRHYVSDQIDLVLIHPVLGLPIFAFLMWLVFTLVFAVGEKPMTGIEAAVNSLSDVSRQALPPGLVRSLLVDGIIAGVGGVVVFLPNIMLLFLAIAVLEDTGYMARAAFVMDRLMHKIGLHGKSFIPMLIGFGCTVPAFMGARILEDRSDRLVTMHVTTFMSCGARLPVYVLIGSAFWPAGAGTVIFSIYVLGVVMAIAVIKLLRATRFKGRSAPFIMELPPYRVPTLRSLAIHMWERASMYLRKAGTIILAVSIIIWFLMTFPIKNDLSRDYPELISTAERARDAGRLSPAEFESRSAAFRHAMEAERIEYSLAGRFGKLVEPAIRPIGFDWRQALVSMIRWELSIS